MDPIPDVASDELDVIVPAFLPASELVDPALGANNFTQCPQTTATLKCINHPAFTTNVITGIVSLVPIHSHIISGNGVPSAGSGCLTSKANLDAAASNRKVAGVITNIYLFFNVVGSNAMASKGLLS